MFGRYGFVILDVKKMMTFKGPASYAKMASPGGKLTALAFHPTKKSKQSRVINLSLNKTLGRMMTSRIDPIYCCFTLGAGTSTALTTTTGNLL
jgi:hypothetical protein